MKPDISPDISVKMRHVSAFIQANRVKPPTKRTFVYVKSQLSPTIPNQRYLTAGGWRGSMNAEDMTMITLAIASLAVVAVSMMIAGYVLAHRSPVQPQFARITNGRDTADGLKSHRSR